MPVGGTTNIGTLPEGFFRAMTFFRYIYGDRYYEGDSRAETGTVKYFSNSYTGLLASYGITGKLTLDAEIGYFADKTQQIEEYGTISRVNGSGLSHAALIAKYNIISNAREEFEITVGAGARAPLYFQKSELPQHVRPSNGAYGIVFQAFAQKGFKDAGIYTFLLSRAEVNSTNEDGYKYAPTFINSLFATKAITQGLNGLLELRSEIRGKDISKDTTINDSGGLMFTVAPQLSFGIDKWTLSALFEYPIYGYYNSKQLAPNYSVAFVVSYQTKFY